ncbi:hypothetical protein [Mucilaginibacter sp.]|uniref:hypothetical protein n=1 Tax=Mucilaginibacter sp. TaxID=1882438 RepID=UPI002609DDA8|nr:hypothetical protein [Mucilaginibacter sp.]
MKLSASCPGGSKKAWPVRYLPLNLGEEGGWGKNALQVTYMRWREGIGVNIARIFTHPADSASQRMDLPSLCLRTRRKENALIY